MASNVAAHRLVVTLVLIGAASVDGMRIIDGIMDMVLHPKEIISTAVHSATSAVTKIPDAMLVKALESSGHLLKKPHPALGLPVLDPYILRHSDISHNLPGVSRMEGLLENLVVGGLSAYRVKRLAVNWAQTAVNLSLAFPQVDAEGYYAVNGTFGEYFPVFGEGPFRLTIRDLEVSGVVCLRFLDKHMSLDVMDMDYRFSNFQSHFEGLLGDQEAGELANDVLNDKAPQLSRSLLPVLRPLAARHLLGGVNALLRKVPLSRADLLSWLPGLPRLWRGR